jgi:hypothetical protein
MHTLLPFQSINLGLSIQGKIFWENGGLELEYRVQDNECALRPGLTPRGRRFLEELCRQDGLWKSTCFEAFFGQPGQPAYWELNLAASGAWNLYRFSSYRTPQPPQACFDFQIAWLEVEPGFVKCRLETKIGPTPLEASLCVVANTSAGGIYFATCHAEAKPDFHSRASFVVPVAP